MVNEDTKEFVDCRNAIAKHEQDIRRWQRMIKDANKAIEYQKAKLLSLQGKDYYVYMVFVDGHLRYVGKGKKERYKHAISGASSCPELNRDFFQEKCIEVRIGASGLTEKEALSLEEEYLHSFGYQRDVLYNKNIPSTLGKYQIYYDYGVGIIYHRLSSHACSNKNKEDLVIPKYEDIYDYYD